MSEKAPIEAAAAELQGLIDAMTHPLQLRLISELRINPGQGAEELSAVTGEPVRRVRDQLKALADAGLVRVDREEKRRNVSKRFYVLAPTPSEIGTEKLADLPEALRARITVTVVQALIADILGSLEAGVINRRPGHCVIRMPARVDERGWKELAALYEGAWVDSERIVAEASGRLEEGDEPGIPTSGAFLFFEIPDSG
jgi:hypothetical protein